MTACALLAENDNNISSPHQAKIPRKAPRRASVGPAGEKAHATLLPKLSPTCSMLRHRFASRENRLVAFRLPFSLCAQKLWIRVAAICSHFPAIVPRLVPQRSCWLGTIACFCQAARGQRSTPQCREAAPPPVVTAVDRSHSRKAPLQGYSSCHGEADLKANAQVLLSTAHYFCCPASFHGHYGSWQTSCENRPEPQLVLCDKRCRQAARHRESHSS